MAPKAGADRVRAKRIRDKIEAGDPITDDDEAFMELYDSSMPSRAAEAAASMQQNASATERIINIEERAMATGDHLHPDAYAAIARSEGLRADTLLRVASNALIQCNEQYRIMAGLMLDRLTLIENKHVEMLEAVRTHFLSRVDAEANQKLAELAGSVASGGEGGEDAEEMERMFNFFLQAKEHFAKQEGAKKRKKKPKNSKPLGSI